MLIASQCCLTTLGASDWFEHQEVCDAQQAMPCKTQTDMCGDPIAETGLPTRPLALQQS